MSKLFVIPESATLLESEFTLPTIWIQWKGPKKWQFPLCNWAIFHCHVANLQGAVTWNSTWIPLEGNAFSHTFFLPLVVCKLLVYSMWLHLFKLLCSTELWHMIHTESYCLYFEIGRVWHKFFEEPSRLHNLVMFFRQWFHCHSRRTYATGWYLCHGTRFSVESIDSFGNGHVPLPPLLEAW